jgi:hypothetical protein
MSVIIFSLGVFLLDVFLKNYDIEVHNLAWVGNHFKSKQCLIKKKNVSCLLLIFCVTFGVLWVEKLYGGSFSNERGDWTSRSSLFNICST